MVRGRIREVTDWDAGGRRALGFVAGRNPGLKGETWATRSCLLGRIAQHALPVGDGAVGAEVGLRAGGDGLGDFCDLGQLLEVNFYP